MCLEWQIEHLKKQDFINSLNKITKRSLDNFLMKYYSDDLNNGVVL